MPDGYQGQFLMVDLSRGRTWTAPVPQRLKDEFVGGKGFGAKLLWDLCPTGADPLGPDNPLMFLTGPLTATSAPSMRAVVVTKSPATGLFLDSYFGGRFGPEIRFAGYDGIIIRGVSPHPVYLWVDDHKVQLRPADALLGLDTGQTTQAVKDELKAPDAVVACIGPAGENRVNFALICCEPNRQAGRGGAGAVMGAKNLKAVAVRGRGLVQVADLPAFQEAVRDANAEIAASEACLALTDSGTSYAVPWSNTVGTLPYRNYQDEVFAKADDLGDAGQGKHLFLGKSACFACPIRCAQMGAVRTGKYKHFVTDVVEYESAAMFGSNLDISDIRAVAWLVRLCDLYGLDSISAGSVISFAIEAAGHGLIEPPEGVRLEFGDVAAVEYLLKTISFRVDALGDLLARGVRQAAQSLGGDSEAYAMHVKGLEIPGWGVRGAPGMGLAYMTADRGACHQRGFMIGYELGGEPYQGEPVDTYGLEKKAEMLKGLQDYLAGTDCLVKCDFGAMGVKAPTYARLLSAATGRPVDENFFAQLGEKVWNQTRLFNLREGMDTTDERLPRRFVEEALPGGPHQGRLISPQDMDYLRADYYKVRGWDRHGHPQEDCVMHLGLHKKHRWDTGPQLFPEEEAGGEPGPKP